LTLSSIDDKLACKLSRQDLAAVERIYAECILDNPPKMLPGAKEALRSVKENGYRTGLISNTGRTPGSALRLVMDSMGIVGFFDTMTFSNEILVRKPAEGAFRVTLDRLRVLPRAAVHIGDDCDGDILGAKKVGMHASFGDAAGILESRIRPHEPNRDITLCSADHGLAVGESRFWQMPREPPMRTLSMCQDLSRRGCSPVCLSCLGARASLRLHCQSGIQGSRIA
jgi:HAD superfamily hydrolase (TIGR01509 family)